jgi:ADP-ribosylglycohydrolase
MRVSPVGYSFDSIERVIVEAERSARVTHNHPEGIKGAQATALAVHLALQGAPKREIRSELQTRFGYDLQRHIDEIRPEYRFDVSCQGSVPEGIIAFLDSNDFEDAIRNAISLGGDSDTQACIAGGIAAAFYGGVPRDIERQTRARLPEEFLRVIDVFVERFCA